MNTQAIMSMMSSLGGNSANNPQQLLGMINNLTGSKYSMKDIEAKMATAKAGVANTLVLSVVSRLYEHKKSKEPIYNAKAERPEKINAITKIFNEGLPDFLNEIKDDDIDKVYKHIEQLEKK